MDGLYDTSQSSTFEQQSIYTVMNYNTGSAGGYLSTEQFCLTANSTYCADDQQFVAVT